MRLGRGAWEAFVTARGGGTRLAAIAAAEIACGRQLDDASVASANGAITDLRDLGPGQPLALNPWEHELELVRDGLTAWVGPALTVSASTSALSVTARDLTYWWERRRLESPFDISDDLAHVFDYVVSVAMARDPSPGIFVFPQDTGVVGRRSNAPTGLQRAADLLKELARTAVDYVAVGRTIIVGAGTLDVGLDSTVTLTEQHFSDDLVVAYDGTNIASEFTMYGDTTALIATAGGIGSETGLVQVVENETTIKDAGSLEAAAESRLALLSRPLFSAQGTLQPNAPIDFDKLVPGIVVRLRLNVTGITVDREARLATVSVRVSEGDERVVATFTNVGSEE